MERRNFLTLGLLGGIGLTVSSSAQNLPLEPLNNGQNPLEPFYIPPSAEPLHPRPDGANFRVKVRSSQTNMQYSSVEFVIAPKVMGPPPHVHKNLDEIIFVQEGTVSVLVGDEVYEVKAGGWHLRPHGIVHTFWNGTDKPARYIDMYFHQNFEDFLEERLRLFNDLRAKGISLSSRQATQKMDELAARFDIIEYHDRRKAIIDKYGLKG